MEPLELDNHPDVQAYLEGWVLGAYLEAGVTPPNFPPMGYGKRAWAFALGIDDAKEKNRPRAASEVLSEVADAFEPEADDDEDGGDDE